MDKLGYIFITLSVVSLPINSMKLKVVCQETVCYGKRGDSITLRCPGMVKCDRPHIVRREWFKWLQTSSEWVPYVDTRDGDNTARNSYAVSKHSFLNNDTGDLTIMDLQTENEGKYRCDFLCQERAEIQLLVPYMYSTRTAYSHVRPRLGGKLSINLRCEITEPGNPRHIVAYSWLRNGAILTPGPVLAATNDSLVINFDHDAPDLGDGKYQCLIDNIAGRTVPSDSAMIHVRLCICPLIPGDPTVRNSAGVTNTYNISFRRTFNEIMVLHDDGLVEDSHSNLNILEIRNKVSDNILDRHRCENCEIEKRRPLDSQDQDPPTVVEVEGPTVSLYTLIAIAAISAVAICVVPTVVWIIMRTGRSDRPLKRTASTFPPPPTWPLPEPNYVERTEKRPVHDYDDLDNSTVNQRVEGVDQKERCQKEGVDDDGYLNPTKEYEYAYAKGAGHRGKTKSTKINWTRDCIPMLI